MVKSSLALSLSLRDEGGNEWGEGGGLAASCKENSVFSRCTQVGPSPLCAQGGLVAPRRRWDVVSGGQLARLYLPLWVVLQ